MRIAGPSVSSPTSRGDTNIASILLQYNIQLTTAAEASRTNPYFVEVRTPAAETVTAAASTSPFAEARVRYIRNRALERHAVLVSPAPGVPISALLLAVAAEIQIVLRQGNPVPSDDPIILEYSPRADQPGSGEQAFDLERQLKSLHTPTILVFPEATREHLGWDLAAVARTASEGFHYILASTDVAEAQFQLQASERVFWRSVGFDGLYDGAFLEQSLLEGLATLRPRLPHLLHRPSRPEEELVKGRTVREIAGELRSPANIAAMLQSFADLPQGASVSELNACIEEARRYDLIGALRRWYQGLSRREQLLALGLCLFDKSPETQLFAALQELITDVWQLRDGPTPILDHLDLASLHVFFQFVEIGPYSVRVEGALSQQRQMLLLIALESHRRHLQRALPWLVALIKQSVAQGASRQELYGPESQRAHLRATLGEALSETGLLARDITQPALLALVADRRDPIHVLLARALAAWEIRGHGERLLRMLQQWQRDPQHASLVRAMLSPESGPAAESPETLLRAASLLVVTYTIRASRPGNVAVEYWNLLIQLAADQTPKVRHYLVDYTLRMLLPAYIDQLGPLLRSLVLRVDLRIAVCQKLATAYRVRPLEVAQVMQGWVDEGLAADISSTSFRMPEPAEELLAAVVLTLSDLPLTEVSGPLSAARILQIAEQILQHVHHRAIRLTVFTTVFRLANQDSRALQRFLAGVREAEYSQVLQLLTESYIEQRRSLGDHSKPDLVRPVAGQPTPLWWEEVRRPRTPSEVMLRTMLIRPADSRLRFLAFQAFLSFTEHFDTAVKRELRKAREEAERRRTRPFEQQAAAPQTTTQSMSEPAVPSEPTQTYQDANFYRDELVPLLATRKYPQCRESVRELLPLAQIYHRNNPELLDLRLELWEQGGGDLAALADCLRQALELANQAWWGIRMVGVTELANALLQLRQEQKLPAAITTVFIGVAVALGVIVVLAMVAAIGLLMLFL